eukprot:scaffold23095_cov35-Tisochrysis_lutea.AAC.3
MLYNISAYTSYHHIWMWIRIRGERAKYKYSRTAVSTVSGIWGADWRPCPLSRISSSVSTVSRISGSRGPYLPCRVRFHRYR